MFVDPNYSYRLPDFTTVFRYLNGPKMVETPPEVEKVFQTYKDEELLSHMRDLYDGEILYIDDQLRGLLGQIGGPGAIVALTADHGEEFKDHGELLHGKSLHQELTRVPLIFFAPGRVPGGTRVGSLARNVDIPPTLYELAGVPLPPNLDGQSLVPAWLAPGQADVPPAFAHIRHSGAGTDRDFAWEFAALTTTEWKLIKNLKTGELLLFDRRTDLAEKNNLAPSRPEKARELAGRLDAIIADSLKAKKALGIAETQKSPIDPKLRGQLNALGYFNQ
jgi:arylsulfatase A-like enzyme